jgi:hypothetical protein
LAALAVTLFAQPEVSNRLEEIAAVQVTDLVLVGEPLSEPSAAGQDSVKTDERVHFAFVKTAAKAKVSEPPADSLQIVNRLKEWEEFFKTTSPEEFKAMVEQVKGAQKSGRISGSGHTVFYGDTFYVNNYPITIRSDSTLAQQVRRLAATGDSLRLFHGKLSLDSLLAKSQALLNDTALRQRIKNIRIITDSIRIKADGSYLIINNDSIFLQLDRYHINDSTLQKLQQMFRNDSIVGVGTIQRKQKIIH